jgi:hypothetical protein
MRKIKTVDRLVKEDAIYQEGVSVSCVILGFHDMKLKVLLSKFSFFNRWILPVGFIRKDEDLDATASRIIKERTGLKSIYLHQFSAFGSSIRSNFKQYIEILINTGVIDRNHWILRRFISVGYYTLVNYSQVRLYHNVDEEVCWYDINEIPMLFSDHNSILKKALSTIKIHIRIIPLGYKLLPEKFIFSELRIIYEIILGKELDKRNFHRKIMSTGFIRKLGETYKRPGMKAAELFSFDSEKCEEVISSPI